VSVEKKDGIANIAIAKRRNARFIYDIFMYLWAQLTSYSASPREALASALNSEQILSVKTNFLSCYTRCRAWL
jgi:hypothetical protein